MNPQRIKVGRRQSVPLQTKKTLDEIKKILKNRYEASDITLHAHEDLTLIGGVKIEANDEMIDLSLKNKVRQLQNHLLTT